MKFAVESDHIFFLQQQGIVEFAGILSPAQLQEMRENVYSKLSLQHSLPSEIYSKGRDLWRSSEWLRRWVSRPAIAEVAAELLERRPIRLAYTQLMGGLEAHGLTRDPESEDFDLYAEPRSLVEMSPIQGVVGGLIICLEAPDNPGEGPSAFSTEPGNGVFVSKEHKLDLPAIKTWQGGRYLLIVYGEKNSVYIHNDLDPMTYHMKGFGYVYGDRLSDEKNPVLKR